ncbi:GGDEF domain-containing protein [Neorhizobium lilium]|uniref:diguanylate cyclase n=1 Tax=Neorhizobium lilium TaxID=2503024 RepID=A0A444LKW0_9HYPH|nr:GGDEF domain-containing protein [Neorhizobium lilium]RWX80969.1 GGDEF domain-containing protein [Neorhizobium lilium]
MPDFYTLYLVILLFGLSNCVIWGAIVHRYRELYAAHYWLAGSTAVVMGGLILSIQGNSGQFLATVGGNTVTTLGFWLNYMGVRRLHGEAIHPLRTGLLLSLSMFAMLATFHIWYGRNPVYTLAQSVPLLVTSAYLLRRRDLELGAGITSVAMGFACLSHGVIATGNILIVADIMPDLDLRTAAAFDLLVFLFSAITWNFGFLISVIGHLRREVERLANEDDLTGLANRRQFMKQLDIACSQEHHELLFSVILFDLDRFKTINDTYGHAAGDAALKHAAHVFRRHLRPGDLFARLGGDEFCVLLLDLGENEASAIAERALDALNASSFKWHETRLDVTASIGIASYEATMWSRPDLLMEEADRALYETKRLGRNGITVSNRSRERKLSPNVLSFDMSSKTRHRS